MTFDMVCLSSLLHQKNVFLSSFYVLKKYMSKNKQKMPHTANTRPSYVCDIRPKPVNRVKMGFFCKVKNSQKWSKTVKDGKNDKQWSTTVNTVKNNQLWRNDG